MKYLPLYPGDQRAPIELVEPAEYDGTCRRCILGSGPGANTCLPPAGTGAGGTLVIVDQITTEEDAAGSQGIGKNHKLIASYVNQHTRRPFILDAAIKCAKGTVKGEDDEYVEACRPFLRQTLEWSKPDRVIATGPRAVKALLGRSPNLESVRRGYGWLAECSWADPVYLKDGRVFRPIPVFMIMPMWVGAKNSFLRDWINEDVKWACTTPVPALPPWDGDTGVIQTVEDAKLAAAVLTAASWITFDVETSKPMHAGLEVVSLAMSTDSGVSYVWDRAALTDPGCFEIMAGVLENQAVKKVAQVAKFDIQAIEQGLQISVRGLWGDTRVWRRQVESDSMSDLSTMAELVGLGGDSHVVDDLVKQLSKQAGKEALVVRKAISAQYPDIGAAMALTKEPVELLLSKYEDNLTVEQSKVLAKAYNPRAYVYGEIPADILSRYNAADVVITAAVAKHLRPIMETRDLVHAWDNLWGPATEALVQVESWGFPVDRRKVKRLSKHFGMQLDVLRTRFSAYPSLNPNSPPSVAKLLYDDLKLKPTNVSEKTGKPSTDRGSLDNLKGLHPVVDDLLEWRHISKLKSQYADGMLLHIAPDGRIHTTYNVDGARSGRASSENPNMQNIPSEDRGADGKLVKDCFTARPGYVLIAADYKQLEFRVAADLSGDAAMREVFESGIDFHQATAELIAPIVWRIPAASVTKLHRGAAKSFNFGIMYGMQDGGIAARAHCSIDEAKQIRQAVLGKFRRFAAWIQECLAYTRKHGVAWTYWQGKKAHCRQLYLVGEREDLGKKINAENSSFNTPVQGTASFYCLATVTEMVNWILKRRLPAKVVATVHDSIVLEVREDLQLQVAQKLHNVMRGFHTMTNVPLDIDLKIGPTWGSMADYLLPEAQAAAILGGPDAAAMVMADQLNQSSD